MALNFRGWVFQSVFSRFKNIFTVSADTTSAGSEFHASIDCNICVEVLVFYCVASEFVTIWSCDRGCVEIKQLAFVLMCGILVGVDHNNVQN